MIHILKILTAFILIIFLLYKKWKVGYVFCGASLLLASLYRMGYPIFINLIYRVSISYDMWNLIIALTLIRAFEKLLRDKEILSQMMRTVKLYLRRKRCVVASMPLIIGMLPSVGGAYFSAPMVDEASQGINLTSEEKAYTNYWYRHPWEFVLPLYPGIILASAVTGLDIKTFISINALCSAVMILCGPFFGMKNVGGSFIAQHADTKNRNPYSFLPLVILLLMVIVLDVGLNSSLGIVITGVAVYYGYSFKDLLKLLNYAFSMEIILLIFGIVLFKDVLSLSGAVQGLTAFFSKAGIPVILILFILPFVSGMLTGITIGFVGITFPLLMHLNGIDKFSFSFAFASGFSGVLLSPVHVCLILTREYFQSNMLKIYKKLVPSVIIVITAAGFLYLLSRTF